VFVGHTAVALAAKRRANSVSLGYFVMAAFAVDLLWPIFLLAGIEDVAIIPGASAFNSLDFVYYPWSHSLVMAFVWGAVAYTIARWRRCSSRVAGLLGAVVVSHWFLDLVVHIPDLPLWPGHSPRVGLGLWNSIPATFAVEGTLLAAGIVIYLHGARARSWVGHASLWSFILVSVVIWASGPWSSPPPSAKVLALASFIGWLLVAWAAWADRYWVVAPATHQQER